MLPAIIAAVIPALVAVMEELISGSGKGPDKKAEVTALVHDFILYLEEKGKLPDWIKPAEGELETLISDAIEKAVEAL